MDQHEGKFLNEINFISQVEIKEEVILPDNTSDSESTLSDSEKYSDIKIEECAICRKYQSMFIILKNHDCQTGEDKCNFCIEILHWGNCFRSHKESHLIKAESDESSDSTASDHEENKEKCKICVKYEFMIPLLQSHICELEKSEKCQNCNEVLQWTACYKKHKESHESQDAVNVIKEENSSDSTTSDNEEIQKFLPVKEENENEKCQVCLKYKVMLVILEESHLCDIKRSDVHCERCNEIIQWSKGFESHRKTHQSVERYLEKKRNQISFLHFGKKFDCGICLKLNSIVTNLVKNHTCNGNKSCTVCQEVSYWLSCLKNHKESERRSNFTENNKKEVTGSWKLTSCSVCLKFRGVIIELSDHVCERKRGKSKCEICQENSFWLKNLKLHEKHHPVNLPLKNFLSCNNCGKRFSREKMLSIHKSYCESSFLVCEYCDRQFTNILSLKKHRIFHMCRSVDNIQCKSKINEKTFTNSVDTKDNEEFHNNLKILKCPKYPIQFESKIHVKENKKIHR